MFGTDNFIYEDRLSELSELDDSFCQADKINCSTPVKFKDRRSYSLLDVSSLDEELHNRKKLTISTDTIGSGSQGSVCKDSGYVHSESNTSLNSTKEQKRLTELIEDLKFKDVLITELQESNHSLRLKYAEAENRIAELRLKCESHCDCCNFKSVPSTPTIQNNLDIVSHRNVSESCLPHARFLSTPSTESKVTSPQSKDSASILNSNDDSFMKVKRWQDSISTLSAASSDTSVMNTTRVPVSTRLNVPMANVTRSPIVQTRVIGDRSVRVSPLSNFGQMSKTRNEQLESTTRHLATNGLQVLRESMKSPVKDVTLMIENLHNFIIGEGDLSSIVKNGQFEKRPSPNLSDYCPLTSNEDIQLTGKENERFTLEGTAASLSYQNESGAKMRRLSYVDRKLEMERTIREGLNGIAEKGRLESSMRYRPWETSHINNGHFTSKSNSNSLYDCILQASDFANKLSIGLSRIPTNLDQIRTISNSM